MKMCVRGDFTQGDRGTSCVSVQGAHGVIDSYFGGSGKHVK